MKWSLQQLLKINKFPHYFEETLDLSAEIESVEDIYEIGPVNITGSINRIGDETYQFTYKVCVKLVLQCALTLDPVEYVFDEDVPEFESIKVELLYKTAKNFSTK